MKSVRIGLLAVVSCGALSIAGCAQGVEQEAVSQEQPVPSASWIAPVKYWPYSLTQEEYDSLPERAELIRDKPIDQLSGEACVLSQGNTLELRPLDHHMAIESFEAVGNGSQVYVVYNDQNEVKADECQDDFYLMFSLDEYKSMTGLPS